MRRADREITDEGAIDGIFHEALVGHLGLCDGDEPYVVPMNFVLCGSALYLHCAHEGRRMDILRKNPKACLQTEVGTALTAGPHPCDYGMDYRSAIASGTVRVVGDNDEKNRALVALMKKYAGEDFSHAFSEKELAGVTVLCLDIEEKRGKARVSRPSPQ
jgi:hypothetical protein